MSGLTGRHALVTGAGRGIGAAIARGLAERGLALTLVARSEAELRAVAAECERAGAASVSCEHVDLRDREALDALCASVASSADVLVNNAGSAPSAPLERTDEDLWDDTFALNAFAPFALCRAALPAMLAAGFGRIVNLASTAALQGFAYTTAYTASKHALLGLTRALAAELAARGPSADVTVNAVCPGFVDTDLVDRAARHIAARTELDAEQAKARMAALNPGGRLLSPDEVAARVLALVDEAPGTTRGAALEMAPDVP